MVTTLCLSSRHLSGWNAQGQGKSGIFQHMSMVPGLLLWYLIDNFLNSFWILFIPLKLMRNYLTRLRRFPTDIISFSPYKCNIYRFWALFFLHVEGRDKYCVPYHSHMVRCNPSNIPQDQWIFCWKHKHIRLLVILIKVSRATKCFYVYMHI